MRFLVYVIFLDTFNALAFDFSVLNVALAQEKPVLILQRDGCLKDQCAVYKIKIFADGKILYEGKRNTKSKGKQTSHIDHSRLMNLREAFLESNFFSIDLSKEAIDEDRPCQTPGGTIGVRDCSLGDKLYFQDKSQSRNIPIDGIRDEKVRLNLQELSRRVDDAVNSRDWIGEDKRNTN